MSCSKNTAELCTLLVDSTYGELTSRIFALLLRRGRLNIPLLVQHSRLTPRQLRQGLVVLIQQNLVYHNLDSNNITFYEANPEAAYALIRSGKILEIIEARYGTAARGVVQNLLLLGHARVSDLADAYKSKHPLKVRANGEQNGNAATNGEADDEHMTPGQLDRILVQLLEAQLIEPVVSSMFRSPSDTYAQIEKEILRTTFGGSTKGTKQKDELKGIIAARLRKLRPEAREWRPVQNGNGAGVKRPLGGGPNGAEKRRKMTNGTAKVNGTSHSYDDEETILDPNLVVRVNHEKCTVALRSQRLVAVAAERIGDTTASIYNNVLKMLEKETPRCRLDPNIDGSSTDLPDVIFTTTQVASIIDKSIDVSVGIGKVAESQIDLSGLANSGKRRSSGETDEEAIVVGDASEDEEDEEEEEEEAALHRRDTSEDDDISEVEDPRPSSVQQGKRATKVTFDDKLPTSTSADRRNRGDQLKQHLLLLAYDNRHFLVAKDRGNGGFKMDYEGVIESLRTHELDTIILQRFGRTGLRLTRILRQYGKLDEKQLPNIGLLKQRDVRTKLIEMQMAGFVDIQEVPRDSNRTPSRTMFFWYFDMERVSAIVLDSIYKTMSRCLQTLDVEKHKESDIIALAERSDVRGQEEEMLSPDQMNRLRAIREREEQLYGLVFHLDELVGIFKDY